MSHALQRAYYGLLAMSVVVALVPAASAAAFPDTAGTVYETAFTSLASRGVISGYADGMGYPAARLNRVEALKVILNLQSSTKDRVAYYQGHLPTEPLFWDIDQRQWYAPYVEAAFEQRLITGYGDGSLRPGQALRVAEAIALLMRSQGGNRQNGGQATLSPFIENQGGQWYTGYVNAAIDRNLIMHAGRLRLEQAITRGQFFDMAYRLSIIRASGAAAFAGLEPAAPVAVAPQPVTAAPSRQGTAVASRVPYASEKYFSISLPTIGIADLTVTHPQDPFSKQGILAPLQYGVGHLFGYPGAGGKIMIYGHSSGYPWDLSQYTKVFRQINRLNVGDRVYVTYQGKLHTYEVTQKQAVDAADTSPFNDHGTGEELILYTCWPPDSISQRYLVHALPAGAAVAVR